MLLERYNLRIIVGGIFLLFLFGCTDSRYLSEKLFWQANKKVVKLINDKNKKLSKEDVEKIISFYREVINKTPLELPSAKAHFIITKIYLSQKRYSQAQQELKEVINNFSSQPKIASLAYFLLGKIYEQQQDEKSAYDNYEEIMKRYPLTKIGLNIPIYLVRYYEKDPQKREKMYKKATRHYNKLIRDFAGTKVVYIIKRYLASLYFVSSHFKKAEEIYQELLKEIKTKKGRFFLYQELIKCYEKEKKLDEIIQILKKIEKEFSDSRIRITLPYLTLHYCIKMKDKEATEKFYKKAVSYYKKIINDENYRKKAKDYLLLCYLEKKEYKEAVPLLESLSQDSFNPFYSLKLAEVYSKLQKIKKAYKLYEEIKNKYLKNKSIVSFCERKIKELKKQLDEN